MINSLQFLRAVAALMVLFYHSQTMVYEKIGYAGEFTNTGAAGVDIFFIISGFVIYLVFSKNKYTPFNFFAKRIIRVGPPYWLYTSVTVALLLFVPGAYKNLTFEPLVAFTSYLFMASENASGGIGTILGVGWTIAFEMYFYLLFFIAMLVMPKRPFTLLSFLIVIGAVASPFFPGHSLPAFTVVALSALPLEFLAGCLIAKAYLGGIRLPKIASTAFILVGFSVIIYAGVHGEIDSAYDPSRVMYWGLPAALIVSGLVSLDAQKPICFPKFALLIGSASYSLYLCHQFVLAAVTKVASATHLKQTIPAEVLLIVGMVLAIAVSLLSYFFFERPVTNWLNKAHDGGRGKKTSLRLASEQNFCDK